MKDPPIRALYMSANNPAVTCPEVHKVQQGPFTRGPLHRGARSLHDRHREAMPTSCCRPRATSRPTISTAPTAPTGCSGAGRQSQPRGEARSNFDVAQALAKRMGLTDPIFTPRPQDAAQELFKGATGTAAQADPAKLFAGEPIHIAHAWQRPAVHDAVGQARILFRAARQAGPVAPARLERRSASKWPTPPSGRCAC